MVAAQVLAGAGAVVPVMAQVRVAIRAGVPAEAGTAVRVAVQAKTGAERRAAVEAAANAREDLRVSKKLIEEANYAKR